MTSNNYFPKELYGMLNSMSLDALKKTLSDELKISEEQFKSANKQSESTNNSPYVYQRKIIQAKSYLGPLENIIREAHKLDNKKE